MRSLLSPLQTMWQHVLKALREATLLTQLTIFRTLLYNFTGSQEWDIFFPSSITGDNLQKHQMQHRRCGAIVLHSMTHYVQNKFLFIGQGTCSVIFQLNFSCPLL